MVVAGLVIAHAQHSDPGHTGRVQSAIVWRHITFVLQAIAFFLVGLEIPEVLRRLDADGRADVALLVPVVIVALILTRVVFVLGMVGASTRDAVTLASVRALLRSSFVVAWAGARGPVSGLAAFSIPIAFAPGELVPFRDVILATAFCIIVITLLLSLTLGPLARAIGVPKDDDTELMAKIDAKLARAAVERLNDLEAEADAAGAPLPGDVSERLRSDAEQRIRESVAPESVTQTQQLHFDQLITTARAMIRAEQEELIRLRDEEGLPDSIARPMLRALDTRDQALRVRRG